MTRQTSNPLRCLQRHLSSVLLHFFFRLMLLLMLKVRSLATEKALCLVLVRRSGNEVCSTRRAQLFVFYSFGLISLLSAYPHTHTDTHTHRHTHADTHTHTIIFLSLSSGVCMTDVLTGQMCAPAAGQGKGGLEGGCKGGD